MPAGLSQVVWNALAKLFSQCRQPKTNTKSPICTNPKKLFTYSYDAKIYNFNLIPLDFFNRLLPGYGC
jgi:hypothetical protein